MSEADTKHSEHEAQPEEDVISRASLLQKLNELMVKMQYETESVHTCMYIKQLIDEEPAVPQTPETNEFSMPCKAGDTVWVVTSSVAKPVKAEAFEIAPYGRVTPDGKVYNIGIQTAGTKELLYARFDDFGKTVFHSPLDAAKSIVRPFNSCIKDTLLTCSNRLDVQEALKKVGIRYKTDAELTAFLCGLFGYDIEDKYERSEPDNLTCLLKVIFDKC